LRLTTTSPVAWLAPLAACVVAGCEPEARPPAPPGSDASVLCPTGCPGPRDGSVVEDAASPVDAGRRDAGVLDAGTRDFCADLPRAGSAVTAPAGFTPTRIVARWDPVSCTSPALLVALTEGDCALTGGERLVLRFTEASWTDGRILPGTNILFPDGTHPIAVTYVRPDPPSLSIGPCADGTVEVDMAEFARGGRFIARIDAALNDCGVVGDVGANVVATVDVPILQSSGDACP
jgi:hypothetical protein